MWKQSADDCSVTPSQVPVGDTGKGEMRAHLGFRGDADEDAELKPESRAQEMC